MFSAIYCLLLRTRPGWLALLWKVQKVSFSGLEQHVRQPTRGANLLDIVASSDRKLVCGMNIPFVEKRAGGR